MENESASTAPAGKPGQGFGAGAQWGLASLMIGSVVFVASPIVLVFNTMFMNEGRFRIPMGLAWITSLIGVVTVLAIGVAGIVFGSRGWLIAGRQRRCPALPVAGTFLSIAAVICWLIVSIDLIVILATM